MSLSLYLPNLETEAAVGVAARESSQVWSLFEVESAEKIFNKYDDDESGFLDRDEITNCLHSLGYLPDHHLHYQRN